jgi:hypothetical protein
VRTTTILKPARRSVKVKGPEEAAVGAEVVASCANSDLLRRRSSKYGGGDGGDGGLGGGLGWLGGLGGGLGEGGGGGGGEGGGGGGGDGGGDGGGGGLGGLGGLRGGGGGGSGGAHPFCSVSNSCRLSSSFTCLSNVAVH